MSFDESMLPPDAAAYLHRQLAPPFPALERLEREVEAEGQPAVGRQTGSLLRALALSCKAQRVLEVGTNLGYSGLWLCAGLGPQGRFEGIEIDPSLAQRAGANLHEAVGARAQVHQGAALDVLARLPAGQYDLVFLDAVKAEYPRYLDHALRLLRVGGILAADNMFWSGAVWDDAKQDADTRGVREYTRRVLAEPRLATTIVPVEDGLAVSVVLR
ncbi:MAG TPA: O-methyltransferase [Candidatus Thermoplasmatota archaeon]|nr:O-methyltransferase [Candidatus Thermoplasmatota archaeon]